MFMGCYGIGVGRLLGAAIESRHDDDGIIFPPNIAPYDIHLVSLNPGDEEIAQTADEVYAHLTAAGLEVLYDDRDESAGIKFSDADLLGMPLRVTVSRRSMREGRNAELKLRSRDRELQQSNPSTTSCKRQNNFFPRWQRAHSQKNL